MIIRSGTIRLHLHWAASRTEAFAEAWYLLQTCATATLIVSWGGKSTTLDKEMDALTAQALIESLQA